MGEGRGESRAEGKGEATPPVEELVVKLRRRQIEGALISAKRTVELLRQVIAQHRVGANQAAVLIDSIRSVGLRLIAANPTELSIGNVVRRVLHVIREEEAIATAASKKQAVGEKSKGAGEEGAGSEGEVGGDEDDDDDDDESSEERVSPPSPGSVVAEAGQVRSMLRAPTLKNILGPAAAAVASAGRGPTVKQARVSFKHNVMDGVNELLQELDASQLLVSEQSHDHIHENEVILTLGYSRPVLSFLLEARKKIRSFQVIVVEGAPSLSGHQLAHELSQKGVQVTLVPDAAVFPLMSRVNIVVMAARAVLANGGVLAEIGQDLVALAARRHAVPVVVLSSMFQLSPVYPQSAVGLLNDLKAPSQVVDLAEFAEWEEIAAKNEGCEVEVVNPAMDYITPELISLFLTDTGGHSPSYLYRLIAEYYSPEDFVL